MWIPLLLALAQPAGSHPAVIPAAAAKDVAVVWERGPVEGRIELSAGVLGRVRIAPGAATGAAGFAAPTGGPVRLELSVDDAPYPRGGRRAVVTVRTGTRPFSFFLDDVDARYPILIPAYGVAVTGGQDSRSYDQVRRDVAARGLQTELQRIESEPEESFDHAAPQVRSLKCQTWLGLARDMRLFAIGERLDWIEPRFHAQAVKLPEMEFAAAMHHAARTPELRQQGAQLLVHGTHDRQRRGPARHPAPCGCAPSAHATRLKLRNASTVDSMMMRATRPLSAP